MILYSEKAQMQEVSIEFRLGLEFYFQEVHPEKSLMGPTTIPLMFPTVFDGVDTQLNKLLLLSVCLGDNIKSGE